jgi:hypothetical protein
MEQEMPSRYSGGLHGLAVVQFPAEARNVIFPIVYIVYAAHRAHCPIYNVGSFLCLRFRGVTLTTYIHLVSRLRTHGGMLPILINLHGVVPS